MLMKTYVYCLFSAFFLLLFASCSEDEALVQPSSIDSISKTSNAISSNTEETITSDMLPYISKRGQIALGNKLSNDIIRSLAMPNTRTLDNLRISGQGGVMSIQGVEGPFHVSSPPVKIYTDVAMSFPNGIGNLAAGVYFCDIYESRLTVTPAPGKFIIFQGASIEGYSNVNTRTIGTYSVTNGSTSTYATYSIIVKSNTIGQTINAGPFPTNLNNNVYTYSVYTP